ncbi:MAG: hypothetical protein JOZ38_02710 [Candidatus Eremiobacteraeota bacterium]|nr:hypothetical protein [Candidatus Eremiobacteraeota bacterium]
MVADFLFIFALSAAASPTPSPAASAPPALKEIGHVRATAACAEVAVHANSAISKALRDDILVTQVIGKLEKVDLDNGNAIDRRNSLQALGDLAKQLRAQAVAGDNEVKRLRDLAAKSTDPTQKKELKSFADELGGALYRQKQIANDLNGMLAYFDEQDMLKVDESVSNMIRSSSDITAESENGAGANGGTQHVQTSGMMGVTPIAKARAERENEKLTDTQMAENAAHDFEARTADITNDEGLAADHSEGAVSGC